jgi:uncharacterized oxidoreductase
MKTSNRTVLITGGGTGIGFETAKLFSEKGSKVILVGRTEKTLKSAAAGLRNVDYFVADVTKEKDLEMLVDFIRAKFPSLDLLINNAAAINVFTVGSGANTVAKAMNEMAVNYLAVIGLTEMLLPLLEKQPEAAIVNTTSIVALTPANIMPTYSASKAALRSYTQVLRYTLQEKGSRVKVFELIPPLVNTEFSKDNGGERGIPPEVVARETLNKIEDDVLEIRPGMTDEFYHMFFDGSENAIAALHQAGR